MRVLKFAVAAVVCLVCLIGHDPARADGHGWSGGGGRGGWHGGWHGGDDWRFHRFGYGFGGHSFAFDTVPYAYPAPAPYGYVPYAYAPPYTVVPPPGSCIQTVGGVVCY